MELEAGICGQLSVREPDCLPVRWRLRRFWLLETVFPSSLHAGQLGI